MSVLRERIKRDWIEQAQADIRELRREGSPESMQMAQLLQEALDECMLEVANPDLFLAGSASAQSDQSVLDGALEFMRERRH